MMLEPMDKGLVGTVLRYDSEVRNADTYFEDIPEMKLPDEMKDLAHVIIERKAGHFRPEDFNDRYEDAVVEFIRAKQAGMPAKAPEQPSRPSNVVSIMDALRKSIAVDGGARPPRVRRAQTPRRRLPQCRNRRLRRRRKAKSPRPRRRRPHKRHEKRSNVLLPGHEGLNGSPTRAGVRAAL